MVNQEPQHALSVHLQKSGAAQIQSWAIQHSFGLGTMCRIFPSDTASTKQGPLGWLSGHAGKDFRAWEQQALGSLEISAQKCTITRFLSSFGSDLQHW